MGGCTTNKIPPRTWKWQIEEEKTKNFLLSYQQHVEQFKKAARLPQKDARVDGCEDHLTMKNFQFHFLPLNLLWTKCAIFLGLPSLHQSLWCLQVEGPVICTKLYCNWNWKLTLKCGLWNIALRAWKRIIRSMPSIRDLRGLFPLSRGNLNKSKRPVDALAVKAYITHLLKTWNQEMQAHLKMFHLAARNNSFPRGNNFDRLKIRGGRNWGVFARTCFAFSAKTFTCGIRRQSLKKSIIIGLRLTFLAITFMHWNWSYDLSNMIKYDNI